MVLGNALLFLALLAVNAGRLDSRPFTPGAGEAAALVFLGVVQIGLAYVFFTHGIARVTALEAGIIGMLEPVLNPIWVFAFLGETPGWWAVGGGCVVVSAVLARLYLADRPRGARALEPASP
jgi:drug/metabolite transporter (DMT)-like permease